MVDRIGSYLGTSFPLFHALMGAACRRLVEDLHARYGSSITNVSVSVLQSAAKLVISQGELLYPGREYAQIRR